MNADRASQLKNGVRLPGRITPECELDLEDIIKQNAELVIRQMSALCGFPFGYDARSVAWLDGYIERQRARSDHTQELVDGLVNVFGSYLGECIKNNYGGYWENEAGQWRVSFNSDNAAYPFAKVRKQLQNGPEDSIMSFFEAIPVIFESATTKKGIEKTPWWKLW